MEGREGNPEGGSDARSGSGEKGRQRRVGCRRGGGRLTVALTHRRTHRHPHPHATQHLQSPNNHHQVLPSLHEHRDEVLLKELLNRWNNHKVMVRWLSRFFNYLDR